MEDIADADYAHARRVCKDFEIKNLGEYHDMYVHSNTLLLVFFYPSITHFNRKLTVARHYIHWCAWESTSKNLLQSQLDIGILI